MKLFSRIFPHNGLWCKLICGELGVGGGDAGSDS
jgi:hypothetical protein